MRGHDHRRRILLGIEFRWRTRQRLDCAIQPEPRGGERRARLRVDQRWRLAQWHRTRLRRDDQRRGVVLGQQWRWPAGQWNDGATKRSSRGGKWGVDVLLGPGRRAPCVRPDHGGSRLLLGYVESGTAR